MNRKLSSWADNLSDFFASRKGLPIIIGMVLVVVNFLLQFFPGIGWLSSSNFFLHLGIILALMGILLSWAL